MQISTISDIGCIKIYTNDCAFYFSNNVGDGGNIVKIFNEPQPIDKHKFMGSFIVKSRDSVRLSYYDCGEEEEYVFDKIGRWFVYLYNDSGIPEFIIYWLDDITE